MENRLSYQEFEKRLLKEVSQELSSDGRYRCELTEVQKNNVKLVGLSIRREGSVAAPNFYLYNYYQSYLNGKSIHEISQELVAFGRELVFPEIKLDDITKYVNIKDKLRVQLVSRENNQAYYKQGPYKMHPMGTEVLYIELNRTEEGTMQMHVTNAIAEQWGVPKKILFESALKNTQNELKVNFYPMHEAINTLVTETTEKVPEIPDLYVLSNIKREHGATVVLYPDILKQIRDQLGDDYYILPSSIHESIILSKQNAGFNVKELRNMVREINQSQVAPEEVLSNEVFEFKNSINKIQKCVKEDRER